MSQRTFSEGFVATDAHAFNWRGNNGYAEASDLPELRLHQVWQDSCDEGFTIECKQTGKRRTFVKFGETRDSDNELQATVFVSLSNESGRTDKPAVRLQITIFND